MTSLKVVGVNILSNGSSGFFDVIVLCQICFFILEATKPALNHDIVRLAAFSIHALAGVSGQRRIECLKKKCNSRFQNILIYLFESTHIIDRFVENIVNINGNSDLRRILILAFISGILELGLNTNDYRILLDLQDVERVIKRNKNCGELVDIERGKIVIKSSVIAKELMMRTEVFTQDEVFDVLVGTIKKLDNLYLGSDKYKNAMINLVSRSYLSYVYGYKMESNKFIEYYEKVKELNFCKHNLFFWEQYAIVCVKLNQFDRAGSYFKTAYSFAKQKGYFFQHIKLIIIMLDFCLQNNYITEKGKVR